MTEPRPAPATLLVALVRRARRLPLVDRLRPWADPWSLSHRLLRRSLARAAHFAEGRLLDIGCGTRPYVDVFAANTGYVGIDLPPNRDATVHADALALPFRDAAFDTVLCTQVLEHVAHPRRLIAEAARVLRLGGVLVLTTPQTWGLHHEPHDYYRYTIYGLRHLATEGGLEVLMTESTCGLWATFAQRVADTIVDSYLALRQPEHLAVAGLAMAPVLAVGSALDRMVGTRGDTLDNLVVARKTLPRDA